MINKLIKLITFPLILFFRYERLYCVKYHRKDEKQVGDWNGKVRYYTSGKQQGQLPGTFTRRINGCYSLYRKVDEATGRNKYYCVKHSERF